jgi:acyl-CoA-binding protein
MESECEERVKLGTEFIDEMKALFARGYSTGAIGEKLGFHRSCVHRRLHEAGVDLGGPGRKTQITDEYMDLVREMKADGLCWRVIAAKIGFSERQLQKKLNGK